MKKLYTPLPLETLAIPGTTDEPFCSETTSYNTRALVRGARVGGEGKPGWRLGGHESSSPRL